MDSFAPLKNRLHSQRQGHKSGRAPAHGNMHDTPRAQAWSGDDGKTEVDLSDEELIAAILEQASPIFIALPDGTLKYANSGYRPIAALLNTGPGFDGKTLPERHRQLVFDVVRGERAITVREAYKKGSLTKHYLLRVSPVFGKNQHVIAVTGAFTDTTREIEAMTRAQRERQRFLDVTRSASDWIWETDENNALFFVSERITEALGIPPAMLKGRNLFSIGVFRSQGDRPNLAVESVAARRPFRDAVVEITSPENERRTFHLSGVPVFDEAGRFKGYRGAGNDVTARVIAEENANRSRHELTELLEELRRKNEQLEYTAHQAMAATRAKDEFLATMSHELRTPLNAVIGFSEMMQMQPFGKLHERYADYNAQVLKAGRHLLTLIEDCLDVARIEVGALPLSVEPVRLSTLIRDARALITLRAESKGVDISELRYDGPVELLVDPTRSLQIFVNLITNGVKFTPEGGRIGIDVSIDRAAGLAHVTVWDTGPGIPPEKQSMVFDKFQQIHGDILSREKEGIGLGLTLSRQFARLMGGDVTLQSAPGQGCRFTVSLPLNNEERQQA